MHIKIGNAAHHVAMTIRDQDFVGVTNEWQGAAPFTRKLVKFPTDAKKDLTAYWNMINLVAEEGDGVIGAMELFAGAGIMATLLQHLCNPKRHWLTEHDPRCVDHLNWLFRHHQNEMKIELRDAWTVTKGEMSGYDFMSLDYSSTLSRWMDSESQFSKMLDDAIWWQPRWLDMSDKSMAYFHVNKRKYSELLGVPITSVTEYYAALNNFFIREYGYHIRLAQYYNTAAHLLLEPASAGFGPSDIKQLTAEEAEATVEFSDVERAKELVQ